MLESISHESERAKEFEISPDLFAHPDTVMASNTVVGAWLSAVAWSHKWGTRGVVPSQFVNSIAPGLKRLRGYDLWFTHDPQTHMWELRNFFELTRPTRTAASPRKNIPREVREFVYARDGHACKICGATDLLSLDHIHPWSLGGADTVDNLQTLCRSCNSRKGARV